MKSCLSTIGLGIAVFAFFGVPARRGRLPIDTRHTQRPISSKGCRDFTGARPPERL